MLLIRLVPLALALAVCFGLAWPMSAVRVQTAEPDFNGVRAFQHVRELVERFPNRVTGTRQDEASAEWVAEAFRQLGLEVHTQRFTVLGIGPRGLGEYSGVNVLGLSQGVVQDAILIGAHRDIVVETSQGAVDNGSGTGSMLELARVLTASQRHYTYVFASFGAEEVGLGGSRYYVGHPIRPTRLAISMDVTGLTERSYLNLIDWASLPLTAALYLEEQALSQQLIAGLRRKDFWELVGFHGPAAIVTEASPVARPLWELLGLYGRSGLATDSTPFALMGTPAVGIGWETRHGDIIHTPADRLDKVDAESLALSGRLAQRLVLAAEARRDELLGSTRYLRLADGAVVPPWQMGAAELAIALFVLSGPALLLRSWAAPRARVKPGELFSALARAALPAAVAAGLAASASGALSLTWPVPGEAGRLWLLAVLGSGLLAALGWLAAPPVSETAARLAYNLVLAALFFITSALLGVLPAALVASYAAIALPLIGFRPGWRRIVDCLLAIGWGVWGLAALGMAQAAWLILPEMLTSPAWTALVWVGATALFLGAGYPLFARATPSPRSAAPPVLGEGLG